MSTAELAAWLDECIKRTMKELDDLQSERLGPRHERPPADTTAGTE
jgi:hypothetical protein